MKVVYQIFLLSFSLFMITACDGGGGKGASISLKNASVKQNGVSVVSVDLVDGSAPISLQWDTSFSNMTNLYSMTIEAVSSAGQSKRLLYQNCSKGGSSLYNCGNTGSFECQVSSNQLDCRVNGLGSAPSFDASFSAISFQACVFDNSLNQVCDEKRVAVNLLIVSDVVEPLPGPGPGPGPEPEPEPILEDELINIDKPSTKLRDDLIPPMPNFSL